MTGTRGCRVRCLPILVMFDGWFVKTAVLLHVGGLAQRVVCDSQRLRVAGSKTSLWKLFRLKTAVPLP